MVDTETVTGASLEDVTRQLEALSVTGDRVTGYNVQYLEDGQVIAGSEARNYKDASRGAKIALGEAVAPQYQTRVTAIYAAAPGPQSPASRKATYRM